MFIMADIPAPGSCSCPFPSTHWSRIIAAGSRSSPESQAALAELCKAYWYPLYAFVRRRGHDPHSAEDIVQGFFATLLEKDGLTAVDRTKGRFRSFLVAACSHFLANRLDYERTLKRGRGQVIVPIDRLEAEVRYGCEPVSTYARPAVRPALGNDIVGARSGTFGSGNVRRREEASNLRCCGRH